MQAETDKTVRSLECPRCGHHLDGNADAAEARGEVRGVCTECALPVEWAKLRADAIAPKWFVEARHSSQWMPSRLAGTLVRCLRPFRFWGAIDLAMPLSWRGAVAFLIGIAALMHVAAAGQRVAYVWPDCRSRLQWNSANAPTESVADLALAVVAPTTRFSGSDILRYTRMEQASTTPFMAGLRTAARFALLAVYPMCGRLEFGSSIPGWAVPTRMELTPTKPPLLWPEQLPSTMSAVVVTILAPLSMLLLPTSLRRARVRPRHFLRIMLYSTALVVPIAAISFALPHLGAMYGGIMLDFVNPYGFLNAGLILLTATAVLVAVWMTAAAGRYLRLPHAMGVGVSCALVAVLLTALVQVWRGGS